MLQLPQDQRVQGPQIQRHGVDVAVVGARRRPAWGWGWWRGLLCGVGEWQRVRCQELVRLALCYEQHAGFDLGGLQGLRVGECEQVGGSVQMNHHLEVVISQSTHLASHHCDPFWHTVQVMCADVWQGVAAVAGTIRLIWQMPAPDIARTPLPQTSTSLDVLV